MLFEWWCWGKCGGFLGYGHVVFGTSDEPAVGRSRKTFLEDGRAQTSRKRVHKPAEAAVEDELGDVEEFVDGSGGG